MLITALFKQLPQYHAADGDEVFGRKYIVDTDDQRIEKKQYAHMRYQQREKDGPRKGFELQMRGMQHGEAGDRHHKQKIGDIDKHIVQSE